MHRDLQIAMESPDEYVIIIEYLDDRMMLSRRFISPIRYIGEHKIEALCLAREAPRHFWLARIQRHRLVPAHLVEMPAPIEEIPM